MPETEAKVKQTSKPANSRKKKPDLTVPDSWPAKEIKLRPIEELVPYARNSRTHSAKQIAKIKSSIQEFGFTAPVLIKGEDGTIGAGHGRVMALQELGEKVVPTIEVHGWDEAKFRAYVIADNRLAEDAGWDHEMLAAELQSLNEFDFDLSLTGLDEREITRLLDDSLNKENEDNIPIVPAPEYTTSRPADIWCMGDHRLIVGSCTEKKTVERLLEKVKPNLMVTDPPYGVEYDPSWRKEAKRPDGTVVGARSTGKVQNDERADWTEAWALFPGNIAYVWHASSSGSVVEDSLKRCGFEFRSHIVWDKTVKVIGRGAYHWQHECCWYMVRKGNKADWRGGRDQSTVWPVPNANSTAADNGDDTKTNHGTQKPVELYRRSIQNHTSEGMAVYDPFSGSGTLFIACEQTGRIGFGCEIDTSYADVIVERWQDFTGEAATLLETGQTFEEVRKARETK